MSKRARFHNKWILRQLEKGHSLPAGRAGKGQSPVALSQQQLGNRAVQRLLAQRDTAALLCPEVQRQAEEQDKTKTQVKVGKVEIKKPVIETYDVRGSTLREVAEQVLPAKEWFEYRYTPTYRADKGTINQADVTVQITVRVPRWVGDGWESATVAEKAEWLRLLRSLQIAGEGESVEDTLLPRAWLCVEIDALDDQLKGMWKGMMQEMQAAEQSPLSTARRRAIVLQRRLYGQPEGQFKAIVDKFGVDLKPEQEAYAKQMQLGEQYEVSVGTSVLLQ
jgi:hypothetical protein